MSRPVVSVSSPTNGQTGVAITVAPYAIFDQALLPASVNFQTVQLLDPNSVPLTGTVVYDAGTRKVTFTPTAALAYSTVYIFRLVGWNEDTDPFEHGIMNPYNEAMNGNVNISFTTQAPPIPIVPPPPGATNTQDVVIVDPANADILVPLDLWHHDHKISATFAYPVPLTQYIYEVINNTGIWEDVVITGVTAYNSTVKVLNWELTTAGDDHTFNLKCDTTLVATGGRTGAGRLYFTGVNSSGILGSINIISGSTSSGTITVDYDKVPIYGHLSLTGLNCIGLFGASYPEIDFQFEYPNLEAPVATASPANTYVGRVTYTSILHNASISIEVGHYIEDLDNLGLTPPAIIWEQLDLLDSYQWVLTFSAGIGSTTDNIYGLPTDHIYYFVTLLYPYYTTIPIIRLNLGPFIRGVTDDTIARMIYEISWLTRRYYYEIRGIWLNMTDLSLVPATVLQYIICRVKLDILDAASGDFQGTGSGVEKVLGDFRVSRSASGASPLKNLRDKYNECLLDTGHELGIDHNQLQVRATIFAEVDPRRPITDWSWRRWPTAPTTMNQTGMFPESSPGHIVRSVPPDIPISRSYDYPTDTV